MNPPKVYDSKGNELVVGARVRSTGAETKFIHAQFGFVTTFKIGPPVVAVKWDRPRGPGPYWHSVDLMWRCLDLQIIDSPSSTQQTTEEAASAAPEKGAA